MLKNITIGQFFPGESFVHKLDARMKIILTIAIIVEIFVCDNYFSLALVVAFVILCVGVSGIPVKVIFRGMKAIYLIIILTSLLQIFYNSTGEVLVEWWKITITTGGIKTAIFLAVRIIALILISSLMTYTTSPTVLTDALERLLSPLNKIKVPVHTLAMMMTIALRFIPILIDEIDKIMSAQKARGSDIGVGNLAQRAKALVPIFVPLFVNSFRRAYELAFAMECRCYRGGDGRTRMKKMHMGARDWVALSCVVVVLAGIITLNILFEAVI